MSVTAAASTSYYTSSTDSTSTSDRVPQQSLDQSDFLSLLTTQLANQDPLSPMEDTDYIAQMASFSTLEMMSEMNSSILALTVQQSYMNAQTLLGREVTVTDDDGNEVTGVATGLTTTDDGSTNVVINGQEYSASSVVGINISEETSTDSTTDTTTDTTTTDETTDGTTDETSSEG